MFDVRLQLLYGECKYIKSSTLHIYQSVTSTRPTQAQFYNKNQHTITNQTN